MGRRGRGWLFSVVGGFGDNGTGDGLFHPKVKDQDRKYVKTNKLIGNCHTLKSALIREGCKKSKWKFKMAFAMKGGGSRRGLECHIPILKNDFC